MFVGSWLFWPLFHGETYIIAFPGKWTICVVNKWSPKMCNIYIFKSCIVLLLSWFRSLVLSSELVNKNWHHFAQAHDIFLLVSKRSELLFHFVRSYTKIKDGRQQLSYKYSDRYYIKNMIKYSNGSIFCYGFVCVSLLCLYTIRFFVRDEGGIQREIEIFEPQKFRTSKITILQWLYITKYGL